MSGFYKLLSLALAVVVAFLLYQSNQTKDQLEELAARIDKSPAAEETAPSWNDPDLQKPYPESVPQQVASLIDAFEPLDGKYDRKRIAKVVAEIDNKNLQDVLDSIDWQSDIGKAFADELIKRKAIDPEKFKTGDIVFRDYKQVRYCLTDPLCYELFEKCCLSIKCCIHRYCHVWPCKGCTSCWSRCCYSSCCSKTIQIGMVGDPGTFKTVKKIRFEGTGVSVALDSSDSTIAVVTIPPATGGTGHSHSGADITSGTITKDHLSSIPADMITWNKLNIANGEIPEAKINFTADANHNHVINSTDIQNGSITKDDLSSIPADMITWNKLNIANGEIPEAKINFTADANHNHVINSTDIQNGSITKDDLSSTPADMITWNKLNIADNEIPEGKINFPATPGHGHSGYAISSHDHAGLYLSTTASGNVLLPAGKKFKEQPSAGNCYQSSYNQGPVACD